MSNTLIIIIVVGVIVLLLISLYNRLVKLKNQRENAFADIDVQLRLRHDLIPQLVNAVKGYMKHEKELLENVTAARTGAATATTINEKIAAEQKLDSAISGLNIAVEAYPDLKASNNFMQLQTEIGDVENKLAAARRFFNSATRELNNATEVFPSNLIAGMFNFKAQPMYEVSNRETLEENPPKAEF